MTLLTLCYICDVILLFFRWNVLCCLTCFVTYIVWWLCCNVLTLSLSRFCFLYLQRKFLDPFLPFFLLPFSEV